MRGMNAVPAAMVLLIAGGTLNAQSRLERYALILEAPPLALDQSKSREAGIKAAQANVRAMLDARNIKIIGSASLLVNAIYVRATEEQAEELGRLAGVHRVAQLRRLRRELDKAAELVNAPAAYNVIGGPDRAGQGVKIGIIDSGIDHNHPALREAALGVPPGYPKCRQDDCAYTNRKVIVARSYVNLLAAEGDPEISRPDDLSPRDRVGHGTAAAMIAAGREVAGPAARIRGIAPGAFLANYKIFGSPGVNDYTFDDVVIAALEDALLDGIDIVSLSFSGPALWAASDRGEICGLEGNDPCDLLVSAVENAVRLGLTVVTVAGNDGDLGYRLPTRNSIRSPGNAPSAITVAASTNSQAFYAGAFPEGNDVPSNQRRLSILFGDGPRPPSSLSGPLRDVRRLDDNGKACSPLTNGSLNGAIALIDRGDCGFAVKVNHAHKAGAAGVLIVNSSNGLFPLRGLAETGIPTAMIGREQGDRLRTLVTSRPDRIVKLDPALQPVEAASGFIAYFSSQGPAIGDALLKPDITAVGHSLYVATQSYDANGDLYDPSGFTVAQGTSFAAPMVAGAAALARQRYPELRPGQIKSLIVNTAFDTLNDFDYNNNEVPARWIAGGPGILDVREMVRANYTIEPASISFGATATLPLPSRTLTLTNLSNSTVSLSFEVNPADDDPRARVQMVPNTVAIPPRSSRQVTVRLTGAPPNAGIYEGEILARGGAVVMRIPYLYLVGDNQPFNIFPLRGYDFSGIVNERLPGRLTFKVVDRFGLPVSGVPIRWGSTLGDGQIDRPMDRTDELGIGESRAILGPRLGEQEFAAEAGDLVVYFTGRTRLRPVIETSGVVNAATERVGQGLAPGSVVSIFGRGLSDSTRMGGSTPELPLSLSTVSVSFDDTRGRRSYPGRLYFVSENLVTVQVPWELQGLNGVQMKLSIGDFSTAPYQVPLAEVSPGVFEYSEALSGRLLASARDEVGNPIGTENPARRGRAIVIDCNGLGPVENQPPSGRPTPASPGSPTRLPVEVTIGGQIAQVQFAGLTPDTVGFYQIRLIVPDSVASGLQPLLVSVNGVSSRAVQIPVQ